LRHGPILHERYLIPDGTPCVMVLRTIKPTPATCTVKEPS
jgi:hypothetical protein